MRDDVRDFFWGTGFDDPETGCGQPLPVSNLFPPVQVHDWTQNPPLFKVPIQTLQTSPDSVKPML